MSYRPTPFTPPDFTESDQNTVAKIVRDVLYPDKDVSYVKGKVEFRFTYISLDDDMNPTTVHPAFWSTNQILSSYAIIESPVDNQQLWNACHRQFIENRMTDATFKIFHAGTGRSKTYLPIDVWYEGYLRSFRSYSLLSAIYRRMLEETRALVRTMVVRDDGDSSAMWNCSNHSVEAIQRALEKLDRQNEEGMYEA
ncbi:hypothetical protein F4802DRAFT_613375 [Xylaria palmicola]|nr:hypothetical protein F4802DRAFT_613375 [Xylaria palmicola]